MKFKCRVYYLELFFKCSLSSVLVNSSQCFQCHTQINNIYFRLSTNNMFQDGIININILSLEYKGINVSDQYPVRQDFSLIIILGAVHGVSVFMMDKMGTAITNT